MTAQDPRLTEAEAREAALDVRREVPGPRHPVTATTISNLATVLRNTGRYAEAVTLQREAFEIAVETRGAGSVDAAISQANLATALIGTGEFAEAAANERTALETYIALWRPTATCDAGSDWSGGDTACRGHPNLTQAVADLAFIRDEHLQQHLPAVRLYAHAGDRAVGRTRLAAGREAAARREFDRFRFVHENFVSAAWRAAQTR